MELRDETCVARLRRIELTMNDIREQAGRTEVDNDKSWKRTRSEADLILYRDNLDRDSDLDKFTKFSFWNGIQVDPLNSNILLVLPLCNFNMNAWTTQKAFLAVLKEYLDRLNSMATDERIKTHDYVDVSHIKGNYERLSLFVKLDGSTLLQNQVSFWI